MRSHIVACALLLGVAGCADRVHLTAGHGRSYREAMARQTVNQDAGKQPVASKGLDPQEAAMIAQGYRASLGPKGETVASEQMLIVAPTAQKAGRSGDYMPPASVPPEGR
jgi:hypothetical protein